MRQAHKSRLSEQLKYFGYCGKRFVSEYASKPRIVCKVKVKRVASASCVARQAQLSALYQTQLNRGLERSYLGYNQMAHAQMARSHQLGCGQSGGLQTHGVAGVGRYYTNQEMNLQSVGAQNLKGGIGLSWLVGGTA